MAKVGGALVEGYWPRGIPRRSQVTRRALPALVRKGPEEARQRPALVAGDRTLTFGDVGSRMDGVAAAIRAHGLGSQCVAVAEADMLDGIVLLLGALDAGCRVAFLDHGAPAPTTRAWIEAAGAEAMLTMARAAADSAGSALPVIEIGGHEGSRSAFEPPPRGGPPSDEVAVWLPADDHLVGHSNFSLAAMAVSVSSFIGDFRALDFHCGDERWRWESLVPCLATLIAGRAVRVAAAGTVGDVIEGGRAYAVVRQDELEALIESDPRQRPAWGDVRYLFAHVGVFTPRWRKRVESRLQRPVLPLWGMPEVGPVVGAHPSWFPLSAHGIPLVNVMPVPIDPGSGLPSEVPWRMLSEAELGIEAPSAFVACTDPARLSRLRVDDVVRTGRTVEIDHLGVIRFLT